MSDELTKVDPIRIQDAVIVRAVDWWAKRIQNPQPFDQFPITQDQVEKFSTALTKEMLGVDLNTCAGTLLLSTGANGPTELLDNAAAAGGIPKERFPVLTTMQVSQLDIKVVTT